MGRIVAIGGGEITDGETRPIDRHLRESVDADVPAALFVPTASGDAEGYRAAFDAYYGDDLGCRTRHLTLFDDAYGEDRARADLEWADLVYVGGGSVPRLLERWREFGVGRALRDAHREGTVLAGLSAGAICWFAGGLVDAADSGGGSGDPEYAWLDCLGWFEDLAFTPHADPSRRAAFRDRLESRGEAGIALEDGCAIEIDGDSFRIRSATGDETAYAYAHRDGGVRVSELPETDDFRPLEALY